MTQPRLHPSSSSQDVVSSDPFSPAVNIIGADSPEPFAISAMDLLNSYSSIFITAFLVTLVATPIIRRVAVAVGVVDHPDSVRKVHREPVAYLGGVAVFLGLLFAILVSYVLGDAVTGDFRPIPLAVVIGMMAITFTGFADDVWGWDPRLKIAGQLVAAAALALEDVGVRVAEGLLRPLLGSAGEVLITIGEFDVLNGHIYYWLGTALIAVFVIGGCNSANLLDGLDGLLSGVVAIVAMGLLAICLLLASQETLATKSSQTTLRTVQGLVLQFEKDEDRYPVSLEELVEAGWIAQIPDVPTGFSPLEYDRVSGRVMTEDSAWSAAAARVERVQAAVLGYRSGAAGRNPSRLGQLVETGFLPEIADLPRGWTYEYSSGTGEVGVRGPLTGARVVLCLALLGAVLAFLPYNFNPATIFLGDAGSHLLGYMCVVIILMLGDQGHTHLVFAGLIIFSVPIIDTTLAMIRRRLAGVSMSAADDQHIHHQLRRSLGGVKAAVFAIYGISLMFAVVGVVLAALVMRTELRVRAIYAIALVLFSFIGVVAFKSARRQQRLAASKGELSSAKPTSTAASKPADSLSTSVVASESGPVAAPKSEPGPAG